MNESDKMALWRLYKETIKLLKGEGFGYMALVDEIEVIYMDARTKMDENGRFVVAFRFAILIEYLLRIGIGVAELQDRIQTISEEIE